MIASDLAPTHTWSQVDLAKATHAHSQSKEGRYSTAAELNVALEPLYKHRLTEAELKKCVTEAREVEREGSWLTELHGATELGVLPDPTVRSSSPTHHLAEFD